jgi:hypothetical protein
VRVAPTATIDSDTAHALDDRAANELPAHQRRRQTVCRRPRSFPTTTNWAAHDGSPSFFHNPRSRRGQVCILGLIEGRQNRKNRFKTACPHVRYKSQTMRRKGGTHVGLASG